MPGSLNFDPQVPFHSSHARERRGTRVESARRPSGLRTDPTGEADVAPRASKGYTLADVAKPLAGTIALEIVQAVFKPYRDIEASYRDLTALFLQFQHSDRRQWESVLDEVHTFIRKHAWLLPEGIQARVRTSMSALQGVLQLGRTYRSLQGIIADASLPGLDKPGLLWSAVASNELIAGLIPDAVARSIEHAMDWQWEFSEYYRKLEKFRTRASALCASANGEMVWSGAGFIEQLTQCVAELPLPLQDYLGIPPNSSLSGQAYLRKLLSLSKRFEEIAAVSDIQEGLTRIGMLASEGLFLPSDGGTPSDAAQMSGTLARINAWLVDFGDLLLAFAGLFTAESKTAALQGMQAIIRKPAMTSLLGAQLNGSLGVCTSALCDIGALFENGRGVYARLESICRSDKPLLRKLAAIKSDIGCEARLPQAFRRSLVDVRPALDAVSSGLATGSANQDADVAGALSGALTALLDLVQSPPMQYVLEAETKQELTRLIDYARRGLLVTGQLIHIFEAGEGFEDCLKGMLNMLGGESLFGQAMEPVLKAVSGLSYLTTLAPWAGKLAVADSTAERLSILAALLADPEVAERIAQDLPGQYSEPLRAASKLFQSVSVFPASGSEQSRLAWLRQHVLNADTLKTLIDSKTVDQWSELVFPSDAVLEQLRLFLPLINSPSVSLKEIFSVLSIRGVIRTAQHGLSGLLYHVSDQQLHGYGAVASAALGGAADLMSKDASTRQRVRETLIGALENTFRHIGMHSLCMVNPAAALAADAGYFILVKPAVEQCLGAFAERLSADDAEKKGAIADIIMETLRSARPSGAEFLTRVKGYAKSSPALAAYIRLGAYMIDELNTQFWIVHLAFDIFLLMHAEPANQASSVESLTKTLVEMERLGHAWARPCMQLIPFIPDLIEARRHIAQQIPDAESWLEWGAKLSAVLADKNEPSIVRLRERLASHVAASLTEGFKRLSGLEKPDAALKDKDAPSGRFTPGSPPSRMSSVVGLTRKAGAAAAIGLNAYADPSGLMKRFRTWRIRKHPVLQDVALCKWDSRETFEHAGIELLEAERHVIAGGANGDMEFFEKSSERYILVGDRAFRVRWDSAFEVYRLVKPGASCHANLSAEPAVVLRGGQWFVSLSPPGGGGAGGDEDFVTDETTAAPTTEFSAGTSDWTEEEQDASIQDLWSLLGRIVSGTEPEEDVDYAEDLANFQITETMYQTMLERAGGSTAARPGGVTGLTVGGVFAVLGIAGLIYCCVRGCGPYVRLARDEKAADREISKNMQCGNVETGGPDSTAQRRSWFPRLQHARCIPLWGSAALIAGGTLTMLITWLRSGQLQHRVSPSGVSGKQAPEASSTTDAPHDRERRAAADVSGRTQGRSKLEDVLQSETAYVVGSPSVALPLDIDTQVGRYSDGATYVDIAGQSWKIDGLHRYAPGDSRVGDPSILLGATLKLLGERGIAVVYDEALGWRYQQKWKNKIYSEATPQSPSDYVEHDAASAKGKDRSHLFLELLADASPGSAEQIPSGLTPSKSGRVPRRLFQGKEGAGAKYFIWVRKNTYLPFDWWRVDGHQPKRGARKIVAAGIVRYRRGGLENEQSMLLVYDDTREWTPAYFLGEQVHIFGSAASFRRMSSRRDAKFRPNVLPARHGIVERIANYRFAVKPAHKPLSAEGMIATGQTGIYNDASGAVYYKCASGYWLMDWKEAGGTSSAFSVPDVTHHGYIRYWQEDAEARLHVLYTDSLGLVPSMIGSDGKVTAMTEESGTANWAPSESLMKLVRSFENTGAYHYLDRTEGQPGRLYYDYLGDSTKLYMFLDRSFFEFEWTGPNSGVLHAAWPDQTPCDAVIAIRYGTWSLGWDAESVPRWFEEYMNIVLTQGELGQLLSQTTASELAHHPLDDATALLKRMTNALSACEKQYRNEMDNERWLSVVVLSAQLIAFFSEGLNADSVFDFGFSDEIYKMLGRIYPSRVIEDQVDEAILNEILEGGSAPVNTLERIKKELESVDAEMEFVTAETVKARDTHERANEVLHHRQGTVSPDYASKSSAGQLMEDLYLGWQRLLDAFSKTADMTQIRTWAERYVSWLTQRHRELDDRRNTLIKRRELIRMPEQYTKTFDAYVAGLATGKEYEEKYRVMLSNVRGRRESRMQSRVLRAAYAGALAELATRSGSLPGASISGDELAAAQYYLLNRLRAQSRLHHLIDKLGDKLNRVRYPVSDTYRDIMQSIRSAITIEREADNADLELVNADTAILAAMIFEINTTGKSVADLEACSYDDLLGKFKDKARSLHPYAFFPQKPADYKSLFEILPSSMMGDGKSRYEENDKQYEEYKKTSTPYSGGAIIRGTLEGAQIGFDNMYDIQEVIGLDFPELNARIHYIKLADGSWLYYAFLRGGASENAKRLQTKDNASTILQALRTEMIWIEGDPGVYGKNAKDASYNPILKFMSYFYVLAARRTEVGGMGIKCFFGRVTTYFGLGADKEHQQLWNLSSDEDAASRNNAPQTRLLPYVFHETSRDLNELVDTLKTTMLEMTLEDKVIGFFVPFYSQLRKQQLDENYSIDPISIMLDAVSLVFTVIPGAQSMRLTWKAIGSKLLWQFGKNSGFRGRFLVSHAVSQSGKTLGWRLGSQFASLTYDIFNPITFPFNPLTMNFGRLVSKGLVPVSRRGLPEILSDAFLVKGFMDNMFLPFNLNAVHLSTPFDHVPLLPVGPDLFCQMVTTKSLAPRERTFYIKAGNATYLVKLNHDRNYFALQQGETGLLQALRRRYSDWVGDTVPVPVGSAVEPDRVGMGLWNKPERVQRLLRNLNAARSEVTVVLRLALRVMKKASYSEKTRQAFELAWGESNASALKSFELNVQNMLDYLEGVSLITDVAYLEKSEGGILSALPGSAFDIRRVSDIQSTVRDEDIEAGFSQHAEAITGPGFLNESDPQKNGRYMVGSSIIPLVMRDDDFDPMKYERFVTAYLVRLNHIALRLIREAFVATTSSKRVQRTWGALMEEFQTTLNAGEPADKQTFLDRLSRTYGVFLYEDNPVSAKPAETFVNELAASLDASGNEIGLDVSPLLRPVHGQATASEEGSTSFGAAQSKEAVRAMVANPDNFALLVYLLSDIHADPDRFGAFKSSFDRWKALGGARSLYWKWFE